MCLQDITEDIRIKQCEFIREFLRLRQSVNPDLKAIHRAVFSVHLEVQYIQSKHNCLFTAQKQLGLHVSAVEIQPTSGCLQELSGSVHSRMF